MATTANISPVSSTTFNIFDAFLGLKIDAAVLDVLDVMELGKITDSIYRAGNEPLDLPRRISDMDVDQLEVALEYPELALECARYGRGPQQMLGWRNKDAPSKNRVGVQVTHWKRVWTDAREYTKHSAARCFFSEDLFPAKKPTTSPRNQEPRIKMPKRLPAAPIAAAPSNNSRKRTGK